MYQDIDIDKMKWVITGLRALDLSGSAMSRMREEVLQVRSSSQSKTWKG